MATTTRNATPAEAPLTPRQRAGIDALFGNHLRLTDDDALLVVFTDGCAVEATWILAAARRKGHHATAVAIPRAQADALPAHLTAAVSEAGGVPGRVVILTLEDDLIAGLENEANRLCGPGADPPAEVVRIVDCHPDLLAHAAAVPPEVLRRGHRWLLTHLEPARALTLHTRAGARAGVTREAPGRWDIASGGHEVGRPTVLPTGGLSTSDVRVRGEFVADGAITVNRVLNVDARLARNPVTVVVDDNRITEVRCADLAIELLLRRAVHTGAAAYVRRLEVGTNAGVGAYSARVNRLNRKAPGLHLALGSEAETWSAAGPARYSAALRIDLSSDGGTVVAGDWSYDTTQAREWSTW